MNYDSPDGITEYIDYEEEADMDQLYEDEAMEEEEQKYPSILRDKLKKP